MKIATLLLTAALGWTTCAEAALPPQFQRLKELRAIMDDGKIMGAFDALHPVDRIERVEHDLYRVTGGNCSLDVAIETDPSVRHPAHWYGARAFVLAAKPLVCK